MSVFTFSPPILAAIFCNAPPPPPKPELEKETKHKGNPATGEVRLENRYHGLAWSQSGNNKTVQTLAVNLILACITGALWAKLGERGILREARNECEALRS